LEIAEGWSIPDMRIYPELYDDIKKLYGKFGQSEVDPETVAQLWGHKSSKSSQFRVTKLGCLRAYGLIDGRGKIRVSTLGKNLTYPQNEEELMKTIVEAVKKIPLWKWLFDTFTSKGKDIPTDTLWMDLRQLVGEDKLPPEDAKSKAELVRKAYFEDLKYYKPEFKPKKEEDKMGTEKFDTSTAISENALGRVTVKDAGFIDVKDEATYRIAEAYLKLFAQRLGIKDKPKKEG
jgi:hypothetical protein